MAVRRAAAAAACFNLPRRLLSTSASPPRLLGHFHHPGMTKDIAGRIMCPTRTAPGVRFEPLAAAAAAEPRLSLDYLPFDPARGFSLYDSHRGLLLLRQPTALGSPAFLVCDPVSRRHALVPPLPKKAITGDSEFFGPALLSRAGARFEFDAVCVTVDARRPRAWVTSFRGDGCRWEALPRSRDVEIDFDPVWVEQRCVHAAGSLYWHICGSHSVLAMDMATMKFSYMRLPAPVWDDFSRARCRVGETPDGRLCVGALEHKKLRLCVRGPGSHGGWVLEREMSLSSELDAVPGLPEKMLRHNYYFSYWLSDIDAGRTGRVFIRTLGCGRFSYDMDTGALMRLMTDDGLEYGDPILAYFAPPDGSID
ncbi:hypothetical protein ACP70R_046480 [Stipagrostis hirtigluma subsp. patula]